MPTNTQPLVHPNVLKLRAPHLFDCPPRSRSRRVSYRRSPLSSLIENTYDTDSPNSEACTQYKTCTARSKESSRRPQASQGPEEETECYPGRIPRTLSLSHVYCPRPETTSSSKSSNEALYVIIKLLQNSLAEANADKEWLWSALENASADNKKICAELEKVKAEKKQVVAEFERIWDLLAHRTVEVKVLKGKLAKYEGSAEEGKCPTGRR